MSNKLISSNRAAFFNYFIQESLEVGIVLVGTEVKSIREGKVNLKDSYCVIERGELFLMNMHISPYSHGNQFNHDPRRERKLLAKRREINRLAAKINEKGLELIPTKVYLKQGRIKIEVALAKGKKLYDKRDTLKERSGKREIERALKGN